MILETALIRNAVSFFVMIKGLTLNSFCLFVFFGMLISCSFFGCIFFCPENFFA
jgi:hypothetical protein